MSWTMGEHPVNAANPTLDQSFMGRGEMMLPPLNLSASSRSGDIADYGSFYGGTVNFGAASAVGGGFDLGALVTQYWPLLAAVAVAVYIRRRK